MKMKKHLAAGAAAVALLATTSCAQTSSSSGPGSEYPAKPVKMIVSFAAGGSTDVGARLIAQGVEDKLGQPVVVENRPGASGQVGNTALLAAKPDGYTTATVSLGGTILSYLDTARGAKYDGSDFVPIALYVQDPQVFVVAPDSPYRSLADLVTAAKAAPRSIRAATTGVGSLDHIAKVIFEQDAGVDLAPVHFSQGASEATTAFLGGNVELLIANVGDVKEMVENGQGRVLAVASPERNAFLPDTPTFDEQGYDFEFSSARGFTVPAGTPDDVVQKLSDAVGDVMDDPETLQKLKDLNLTADYLDAAQARALWDETEQEYARVLDQVKEDV